MFYFVPSAGGAELLIEQSGLRYAFDAPPAATQIARDAGPEGLSGTVLTQTFDGPQLPAIHWQPLPGERPLAAWFGWPAALRPRAGALQRSGIVMSGWRPVRMGDGVDWRVPLCVPCRDCDPLRAHQLPGRAALLDGRLVFALNKDLEQLVFELSRLLERPFPESELIARAADVLAIGYRVGLAETLALGLLTRETALAVLYAALDFEERVTVRALRADAENTARFVGLVADATRSDAPTARRLSGALALDAAADRNGVAHA